MDASSKRVVRKYASRYAYRAKPPSSGGSTSPPNTYTHGSMASQIHRFRLGRRGLKHTSTQPRQVLKKIMNREDEVDDSIPEPVFGTVFGITPVDSNLEYAGELVRLAREPRQTWLETLHSLRSHSLYGPSSGSMDPFNAMSLNITIREQELLHYYCKLNSNIDKCRPSMAYFHSLFSSCPFILFRSIINASVIISSHQTIEDFKAFVPVLVNVSWSG
jgi:hypothetical protein